MAIIRDLTPGNNILPMDWEKGIASRVSNAAYSTSPGGIKNMRKKEIGIAFIVDVTVMLGTNLLLKLQHGDTAVTATTDITDAGLSMSALPGPGMFGAKGTVTSASGVFTITKVGKYALFISGNLYKQYMGWAWQTNGGGATFSISGYATGPNLPISS